MGIYGELFNLDKVANAGSPQPASQSESADTLPVKEIEHRPERVDQTVSVKPDATMTPRYRDTKQPRHHATMTPHYHATAVEAIRAAVKVFGKEAATHRFTLEEKRKIRDIVYAYEGQNIRTNENEVTRIGVNFLMEDYQANGENSVLHIVLKALNS